MYLKTIPLQLHGLNLAVKTSDGKIWRDREKLAWVDPSKKEVWDYNIDLAVEAAQNGFDEIQFDYVRFPDKKGLRFSVESTEENRTKNISGFLKEASRRLGPYNVFLSADIFGYVCWNLNDTQIGQKLSEIVTLCRLSFTHALSLGVSLRHTRLQKPCCKLRQNRIPYPQEGAGTHEYSFCALQAMAAGVQGLRL